MLRVRWLGTVRYREAHALQRAMWAEGREDHLLLLEHPHVYTLGARGDPAHILADPAAVGAEVRRTDRGGDVTYHGPGQLVGYPVLNVPARRGAIPAHVASVEQVVIDALSALGLSGAGRLAGYPGVWVGLENASEVAACCDAAPPVPPPGSPRKICAVGVRVSRGRSMHGFALNVAPDMSYFDRIVPCGIAHLGVTSMAAEGVEATMRQVVDAVAEQAARIWGGGRSERQDVPWPRSSRLLARRAAPGAPECGGPEPDGSSALAPGRGTATGAGRALSGPVRRRLAAAALDPDGGVPLGAPKPSWVRAKAHVGPEFRALRATVRSQHLVTVCEEAGCPNIWECWSEGTATFMINGARCTRACGFCLVDTSRPAPLDPGEAERVARAVARMGLAHAVVTAVARDDLADGGAGAFAQTIEAIRRRCPGTALEVLIPDFKGSEEALSTVLDRRPDVVNHNVETVPRLQRALRPSAAYPRSLAVLARAKAAGLVTKSGLIVGMGETAAEVLGTLADLAAVGVDIVTVGQYLRPTAAHVPVMRWWRPEELGELAAAGRALGIAHVEASPLTRSSYHARSAAAAVAGGAVPAAGAR